MLKQDSIRGFSSDINLGGFSKNATLFGKAISLSLIVYLVF